MAITWDDAAPEAKRQPESITWDQPEEAKAEPESKSASIADYGRAYMAGSAGLASSAGWLLQRAGIKDAGKALEEAGNEAQKYWQSGYSDEAKADISKPMLQRDKSGDISVKDTINYIAENPDALGLRVSGSLPGTGAGMGVGGVFTKAFSLIPQLGAKISAAFGYGLGEGGVAGASAGQQTEQQVKQMSHDQLMEHPEYRALYGRLGDEKKAKEIVAKAAGGDAASLTFAGTTLLSAPAGYALARIFNPGEVASKGMAREIGKGTAGEGTQEAFQSAEETAAQNYALSKHAKETPLTQGMADNVFEGAVTGMAMGFGMGTGTELISKGVPNAKIVNENGQESTLGGAPLPEYEPTEGNNKLAAIITENVEKGMPGASPEVKAEVAKKVGKKITSDKELYKRALDKIGFNPDKYQETPFEPGPKSEGTFNPGFKEEGKFNPNEQRVDIPQPAQKTGEKQSKKAPKSVSDKLADIEARYGHSEDAHKKAIQEFIFKSDKTEIQKLSESLSEKDREELDHLYVKDNADDIIEFDDIVEKMFAGKATKEDEARMQQIEDEHGLHYLTPDMVEAAKAVKAQPAPEGEFNPDKYQEKPFEPGPKQEGEFNPNEQRIEPQTPKEMPKPAPNGEFNPDKYQEKPFEPGPKEEGIFNPNEQPVEIPEAPGVKQGAKHPNKTSFGTYIGEAVDGTPLYEDDNGVRTRLEEVGGTKYGSTEPVTIIPGGGMEVSRRDEYATKEELSKPEKPKADRFGAGHMGGVDAVVWDKTAEENGDYKKVGYVHNGKIKVYDDYKGDKDALDYLKRVRDGLRKDNSGQKSGVPEHGNAGAGRSGPGGQGGRGGKPGNAGGTKNTPAEKPDTGPSAGSERDSGEPSYSGAAELNDYVENADTAFDSGKVGRFEANVAALELISLNKTHYTQAELRTLSRYTGWGGLQEAFDKPDGTTAKGWEDRVARLKGIMQPSQYASARAGVLDAYYTPAPVAAAMWSIASHLGFKGGRVLEPSAGTGRFIGINPNKKRTHFDAVELDPTTAKIAKALYQKSNIRNIGFQETNYTGSHSLVIGNPPYGSVKIEKQPIHTYFVTHSLDALQDGGVLEFVITSSFLDGLKPSDVKAINEKAKLVGAIRLPSNVFATTGTKVTTDIVVFQKLAAGEAGNAEEWGHVTDTENGKVNRYFVNHQEAVIGTLKKGRYGRSEAVGEKGINIRSEIEKVASSLPAGIITKQQEQVESPEDTDATPPNIIYIKDGKTYVNITNQGTTEINMPEAKTKLFMAMRDKITRLIPLQRDPNATDEEIEVLREELNKDHDAWVKKYGPLNRPRNRNLVTPDKNGWTVVGLETNYKPTITPKTAEKNGVEPQVESVDKADILLKRTEHPTPRPKVKTPDDALQASVINRGEVDIPYIADILSMPESEVIKQFDGKIFHDVHDGWVTRDIYLSGDVLTKYEEATDENYKKELMSVMPEQKTASEIQIEMGQSWIPVKYLNDYGREVLSIRDDIVSFDSLSSKWHVKKFFSTAFPFSSNAKPEKMIEAALNNRTIRIMRDIGRGEKVYDQESSDFANSKVDEMKDSFAQWAMKDEARRDDLVSRFNNTFNRYARQEDKDAIKSYNVPNLQFFAPRFHQKRATYRAVYGNTPLLLNHTVGSGKTLTSQMIAMEWRRTGKANKPVIATLKSAVPQYYNEFKRAYPGAKILMPSPADFSTGNRQKLLSSITTGDYDAIVISHEQLKSLPNPQEFERDMVKKEIDEAIEALQRAKNENADSSTIRTLEERRKALEERFEKLLKMKRDSVLDFAQMGIDGLIIDESHFFKKLAYSSTMGSLKGMPEQKGSQRAFDLYVKTQYLHSMGNSSIIFMTGTPVTNTIPELFLIQKYLQPNLLKEQGLQNFDSWAKNYTETSSDIERTPAGAWKETKTLSSYTNLPILMESVSLMTDTVTNEEIKKADKNFSLPTMKGNKPTTVFVDATPAQIAYTDELAKRIETTVKDKDDPDNYLAVFGDAARMAIDMRLIDSKAYSDEPSHKLDSVVNGALAKYKEFDKDKGTQLIFSDVGTPKSPAEMRKIKELVLKSDNGDESAAKELSDKYSEAEIADVLTSNDFSVYEYIKDSLIKKGIPAEEIAFIHDYEGAKKKKELSLKVNSGKIRIVLGSTKKLGTGMNVQDRLVAVHHVDIPYTPAELEQRNGRIIRQGNKLLEKYGNKFNIDIAYYATRNTLDATRWQILERKSKFIQQFMSGQMPEDMDTGEETNAELAERMKAEASGDPLLIDKMKLGKKLKKLKGMRLAYVSRMYQAKDEVESAKRFLSTVDKNIANLEEDIESFNKSPIRIGGKTLEKPKAIGDAIISKIEGLKKANALRSKEIGSIGNIKIFVGYNTATDESRMTFEGKTTQRISMQFSKMGATGTGVRVKNIGKVLMEQKSNFEVGKIDAIRAVDSLSKELDTPFKQEEELKETQAAYDDVLDQMAKSAKGHDKNKESPTINANPVMEVIKYFTEDIPGVINDAKNALDKKLAVKIGGKIRGTKVDDFIRKYIANENGLGSFSREQERHILKVYRKLQSELSSAKIDAKTESDRIDSVRGDLNRELFNAAAVLYLESPLKREEIAQQFPEMARELDKIRDYIDNLSAQAMRVGLLKPSQFYKWRNRYLSRLYAVNAGAKGIDVRAGIKEYEIKTGRKIDSIVEYLNENEGEAERLGAVIDPNISVMRTIAQTQSNIGIDDFYRGIIGQGDLVDQNALILMYMPVMNLPDRFSPYYAKEVIIPYLKDIINHSENPAEVDALKGEIESIEEQMEYATAVATFAEREKGTSAIPKSKRYGPLSGLSVQNDLASLIKSQVRILADPETFSDMVDNAASQMLAYFKWAKVPANIFSYPRNFVSNFFQWSMSGANPGAFMRYYIRAIEDFAKKDKWYLMAQRHGMLDTNIGTEEINIALESIRSKNKYAQLAKKTMQKVGDAYGWVDDIAKVARMRYAIEKEGMSELEAIDKAQETHFDYSLAPDLIRSMRDPNVTKNPMLKLLGTLFPTYTQKVIAYLYNTIMDRPATLLAMMAAILFAVGNDDDNEKEIGKKAYAQIKSNMPGWMRDNPFIRIDVKKLPGKKIEITYTDFSYSLPFGTLLSSMNKALHGNALEGVSGLGLGGSPLQMFGDLTSNKDSFTGKEIYYEYDRWQKTKDISSYLFKQFAPGTITKVQSLSETRHPWKPRIIGINQYTYESGELKIYKVIGAKRAMNDAKSRSMAYVRKNNIALRQYKKGKITKSEYESRKKENNEMIKYWIDLGKKSLQERLHH